MSYRPSIIFINKGNRSLNVLGFMGFILCLCSLSISIELPGARGEIVGRQTESFPRPSAAFDQPYGRGAAHFSLTLHKISTRNEMQDIS